MGQVLECSRMKRALAYHEVALTILYVRALLKAFPDAVMASVTDLFDLTCDMQTIVNENIGEQ